MLTASLLKIGFIQLHSDPCVFVRNQNDTQTIMAVYVDDFIIISSTSDENEKVYRGLEGQFKIKRIGEMKRFVGFEVERDRLIASFTSPNDGLPSSWSNGLDYETPSSSQRL